MGWLDNAVNNFGNSIAQATGVGSNGWLSNTGNALGIKPGGVTMENTIGALSNPLSSISRVTGGSGNWANDIGINGGLGHILGGQDYNSRAQLAALAAGAYYGLPYLASGGTGAGAGAGGTGIGAGTSGVLTAEQAAGLSPEALAAYQSAGYTVGGNALAGMTGAQMAQLGLGAAGIGASLYAGNQASQAAKDAAASQQAAAAGATAENARQFNIAQANQAPWLQAGQQALGQQQALMGLGGDQAGAMAQLQNSPGYQFRLNQGTKGLEAGLAARGGMGSGKAMQAGVDYNQNFASNEYGNRLQQLAGLSQTGQNTAVGMGTQGMNYATQQGNIAMNAANANAASNIAQQNATNSSILGGLQLGSNIAANWNNGQNNYDPVTGQRLR